MFSRNLLGVVAVLLAFASLELQDSNPASRRAAPHENIGRTSLQACGACHADVYEEWSESLHARAWTNSNVRQATDNFAMAGCRACHSPMPVMATGLDSRPAFRDYNKNDGVHCLSCHGLSDGVAASRDVPGAPCNPKREPRLLKAEMCYPCHEPTHQAFSEYYQSNAYKSEKRCADCHMPASTAGRHSHGPNGGLNADFVKKGVEWICKEERGSVWITLRNKTGHKFPGEIPSRAFVMKVVFGSGDPVYMTLRKPNKGEDRVDNRLTPDEERIVEFKNVDGAAPVVQLLFKPFPIMPDESAFVIGEWKR